VGAAATYNRESAQLAPLHIGCVFGTTRVGVSRERTGGTVECVAGAVHVEYSCDP
jgi:hypothetical protein